MLDIELADMGDWAGAIVAVVALIFVVLQLRVQRGQHRLQDAESHRQQAAAWREISPDWEKALLAAVGISAVHRFAVPNSEAVKYIRAVERYREAQIDFLALQEQDRLLSADDWNEWDKRVGESLEDLAPYQQAVQRVVAHLAQVSGLVLRGRVPLEIAYDAFGMQLLRVGDSVRNLMYEGYAHSSSCPAPFMMELQLWQRVDAEQTATRLGWGDFLDVARGTAERILFFLDLLTAHALDVGDIGPYARDHVEPTPGEWLADRDRLAVAWRAARRRSRIQAIRATWRLSRAGRCARRRAFIYYPRWIYQMLEKSRLYPMRVIPPHNGWLRAPVDAVLAPWDVLRAAIRSRSVPDVRLLEPPTDFARRLDLELWPDE